MNRSMLRRSGVHHRASRRPLVVTVAIAAMMMGASSALAAEPQPVIRVEAQPAPSAADPNQSDAGCAGGSSARSAFGELTLDRVTSDARTAYPAPVVPVPAPAAGAPSGCVADLVLGLIVKSLDDREPDGANASLDAILIPRTALESGFEVSLPARDRLITLSDPGPKWELVETSCSCAGGSGGSATISGRLASSFGPLSQLTTYPGPVIAVAPGGSGGCSSATSGVLAPFASPLSANASGPQVVVAYPRPVVAVVPVDTYRQSAAISWDASGTVNITDPAGVGGTFSCTWTVEPRNGDLAVKTITKPKGLEDRFDYLATPTGLQANEASPVTLPGTPAPSQANLKSGPWSVELRNLQPEWELTSSECSESDATIPSVAQGAGALAGVDPLDRIDCTFELKLLSPKPGRWRSKVGATRMSCDGRALKLGASTDVGRLTVRDDGDRLIGRALSQGGIKRWDFRRDRDDLLHYTGTARLSIAGARGTFDAELELVNEKRLVGSLSGAMKIRGTNCTFRRSLKLSHIGGN